ncbi:hypothetical protein PBT90_12505 [Algoriphagus halophytocola]|uniref:Uncharacterized protein n=1 Tax=Algoriphagus halophytocola TaxID=2991499 RepID=A0ABY6MPC9_9BACT|nr:MULTISPECIES: hypothetical protein [unclassified Algoriphagus]UZD24206.1 hypothetical protein OM944_06830 [Algoriphagus sp. TR-M5]WBL41575.1 hypothetical protein PBT90_12505 [Algoriphagus sp. TR-M9]
MKNSINRLLAIGAVVSMIFTQSCVETEELVTPNVAAPVLILFEGNSFSPESPVTVASKFLELDKTNILDHTQGIDSIPVSNLDIAVFINNTTAVASLLTDAAGAAELVVSWSELGLSEPTSGSQVRLEFVGEYKDIPFRKYHTVRVN